MYSASASVHVAAPMGQVWRLLVEGVHLRDWFADSDDLAPARPFRFDFGDGDFFTGHVIAWEPPRRLELTWRFMGVGPSFSIGYELQADANGTTVTVTDRGSRTADEADSLREGWTDLLQRLARHAGGERARYEWSIGTAATPGDPPAAVLERLAEPAWWQRWFGGDDVTAVERSADTLTVEMRSARWGGAPTRARVRVEPEGAGSYVHVSHAGWPALPLATRVAERRRAALAWADALAELEGATAK